MNGTSRARRILAAITITGAALIVGFTQHANIAHASGWVTIQTNNWQGCESFQSSFLPAQPPIASSTISYVPCGNDNLPGETPQCGSFVVSNPGNNETDFYCNFPGTNHYPRIATFADGSWSQYQ